MADFHTTQKEESLIELAREGFGYKDSEFPKYFILRLALAKALCMPKFALNAEHKWREKHLGGERGAEYHLDQLTGEGKDKQENFDNLIRTLLYTQHKDELDSENIDIFTDDKIYTEILGKYIHRGLYELRNSWKNSDCIYQWCLDNLNLNEIVAKPNESEVTQKDYFRLLEQHLKKFAIELNLNNTKDSYKHLIYQVELRDSTKIRPFLQQSEILKDVLGVESVLVERCENLAQTYSVQIAKPSSKRRDLGKAEFDKGLKELKKCDFELGVFAGMDIEGMPYCFDLAKCPHSFVAGKSGSGKTVFLQNMILCLLNCKNVEITVIDPKNGIDFNIFLPKISLANLDGAENIINDFISEMDTRNALMSTKGQNNIKDLGLNYKVLIVDELNNLIERKKGTKDALARLAEMARQAGIHLVLGTQRPDGGLLRGLRNNIDGKIALKVERDSESKLILGKKGAENLLGSGDILIKTEKNNLQKSSITHIFGTRLENDEIRQYLQGF